ncbi:hypothetical protein AURDEDRAFT_114447 [Auricularia subglabra TFB-10046 SS5]|nr:hypothetical protein AURDEDRAFT_114447 [Auricularia subglabra TFB-10046 SS5]
MPRIRVRNETSHIVNAGFGILGMKHPSRHRNSLQPGESFDGGDFPSFVPQSFEVRSADGQVFHDGETWDHGLKMAAAGACGSAAVGAGASGLFGLSPVALGAAGMFWRGANEAGQLYAQEADGLLKRVNVWVGWGEMELVIREGEHGIEVWSGGHRL